MIATNFIQKGKLLINDTYFEYSESFLEDLNKLLDNDVTDEKQWADFTAEYGQFYISQCEIGGSVFSTKEIEAEDVENIETLKQEFSTSFEAKYSKGDISKVLGEALGKDGGKDAGISGSQSTKVGRNNDDKDEKTDKSLEMSFDCHGGKPSLCKPDAFDKWEASVSEDYKLWHIINVLQVQPFYYLLDQEKQKKIIQLLPKKKVKKWVINNDRDYDPNKKMKIAIFTNDNRYVGVDSGKGKMVCDKDKCGDMELFWSEPLGQKKIALKAHDGYYVSAEKNSSSVWANSEKQGKNEEFEAKKKDDSKFAFLSDSGRYLTAKLRVNASLFFSFCLYVQFVTLNAK